jgi:Rhodanese-like domain.
MYGVRYILCLAAFVSSMAQLPLAHADQQIAIDVMAEYLMFQEYESGIILPQQIDQSVFESVKFIDTRDVDQFDTGTIPGAHHIEWRQV